MTKATAVLVVILLGACSSHGSTADAALVACGDFDALVQADHNLPDDWADFEPIVTRAEATDELAAPAGNVRRSVEHLTSGDPIDLEVEGEHGLESSITGFYVKCREAGWDG